MTEKKDHKDYKIVKIPPDPKYLPRDGYYHPPKGMKYDDKPKFHRKSEEAKKIQDEYEARVKKSKEEVDKYFKLLDEEN